MRFRVGKEDGRLLRTGVPTIIGNLLPGLIPLVAINHLSTADYAIFALLTTMMAAAGMLDLGAAPFILSQGYGRSVCRAVLIRALIMAGSGALLVLMAAVALSPFVTGSSTDSGNTSLTPLFAFMGIALAGRSWLTVCGTVLQVSMNFNKRTFITIGQPVVQVVLTWLLLRQGRGPYAIPMGLALSVLIFLIFAGLAMRHPSLITVCTHRHSAARFSAGRTSAVAMGIVLSQSDRWILSSMHDWNFVAQFDLANKIGLLPIVFVMSLFGGLVAEARTSPEHQLGTLARRSILRSVVMMGFGWFGAIGGALLLARLGVISPNMVFWYSLVATLAWSTVNVITGPATLLLTGMGRPAAELVYLVPAVLTASGGWALAIHLNDPRLVVVAELTAVVVWSLIFVVYALARIDRIASSGGLAETGPKALSSNSTLTDAISVRGSGDM